MAPVKKTQPSPTRKARKSVSTGPSKSKSKVVKRPPPKQVKTKPTTNVKPKSKKPQYTDAQLRLPAVNSIIPANAAVKTGRGTGKKKNKVYVDDTESMMTILAIVNAEKDGQIESKVMKARQMEEIREARRKEADRRAEGKKDKLEEVKQELKKRKSRDGKGGDKTENKRYSEGEVNGQKEKRPEKNRKRVSFA